MKIRINKSGFLEVERAGEFKEMICPYSKPRRGQQYIGTEDFPKDIDTIYGTPCGDWCPLFQISESCIYLCQFKINHFKNDFEDLRNV